MVAVIVAVAEFRVQPHLKSNWNSVHQVLSIVLIFMVCFVLYFLTMTLWKVRWKSIKPPTTLQPLLLSPKTHKEFKFSLILALRPTTDLCSAINFSYYRSYYISSFWNGPMYREHITYKTKEKQKQKFEAITCENCQNETGWCWRYTKSIIATNRTLTN